MSERKKVNLRVLFLALTIANVLMFAYAQLKTDPQEAAAARIEELQINPGRIRLLGSAMRGPGGQTAAAQAAMKPASYGACLEWGPFSGEDVAKAESALAQLPLAQPAVQRPLADFEGVKRFAFFVREPDAAVVARIAELQTGFTGTEIKAGPCP
jgi:hypothetical protein